VFKANALQFFCEVKASSKDEWLDNRLREAAQKSPPFTVVGGGRNDPRFNHLTNDIHTAVQQFDAVNPRREYPNVLAWVNHDRSLGFLDVLGVLTGDFFADDDSEHPIYRKFSEGRIKDEKARIDMFLWLDDHKPSALSSVW